MLCSKIGLPNILECQFPNSNQNPSSPFMEINKWILIFLLKGKDLVKEKCQKAKNGMENFRCS